MIISYDIENYKKNDKGEYEPYLDATGKYFTVGVVLKETGGKKIFYNPKDMWDYIIELGKKEMKRGKRLICYAHNAKYDFYQIADLYSKNLRFFSESPFIAGYYYGIEKEFKNRESYDSWVKHSKRNVYHTIIEENGFVKIRYNKEIIKFLDTMSLFRMSLKKLGDIIGFPKEEMPLKIGNRLYKYKLEEIAKYCANDCKVTLEAVKYLKDKLLKDGIVVKNLCTINQIAISYLMNKLRKGDNPHILKKYNEKLSEYTWKTRYRKDIHSAYRGGYVRVWKTGFLKNVCNIDFNSLYPYSAMNIKFPDLRTERKVFRPLEVYSKESLFNKIGISRCLLKNCNNKLGLLQIRGLDKSYIPLEGKYLLGTWTNMEIREAISDGYELINVEWSVLYDEGSNPFKEIFKEIYTKRKSSKNGFDNYFYKMILNGSIGKFGQTRTNQEIVVDSIEKVYDYLNRKFEVLRGIGDSTDVLYLNKNIDNTEMKNYYAPIIPSLITAKARLLMYNCYKKVPLDKLCYSDTDSIITEGDFRSKFKIGEDIGEFKVETDTETGEKLVGTEAVIWGTKSKSVGNNIAVSGVFKSNLTLKDFQKGIVKSKHMLGIRNVRQKEVGSFVVEDRDLKKQEKEFWDSKRIMDRELVYIDKDILDISFFMDDFKEIVV